MTLKGLLRTLVSSPPVLILIPSLLISGHDDHNSLENSNEVNEKVKCVLQMVSLARMRLLYDELCVIQNKTKEEN